MSGSWSNTQTTSLTLPTGAVNPQQRIVLDGSTDTILVYNSSGVLIASVAAAAGSDGFGNSFPAGISSSGGIVSQSIVLVYNGVPANGNLIASMAPAAGTDSFGNHYVQGIGTYSTATGLFSQMVFGSFQSGYSVGGVPDTNDAGFMAAGINGVLSTLGLGSPVQGAGVDPATVVLKSGATGQTTGSATAPQVQIVDTDALSACDGLIAGTWIRTATGGSAYTWQSPTAAASWSVGTLQYRLDALDNLVWRGSITYTGAAITGASIFSQVLSAALPGVYVPKATRYATIVHLTSTGVLKNTAAICRVTSAGSLSVQWGDGVAGTSHDVNGLETNDVFWFDGVSVPLGNIS